MMLEQDLQKRTTMKTEHCTSQYSRIPSNVQRKVPSHGLGRRGRVGRQAMIVDVVPRRKAGQSKSSNLLIMPCCTLTAEVFGFFVRR